MVPTGGASVAATMIIAAVTSGTVISPAASLRMVRARALPVRRATIPIILVRIVSLVVSAAPSASGARVLPRVPVVVVPRRAIVVVRTAVPSAPTTAVPIPRIIPIVVAAAVMITSSTTAVRATTTGTSPAVGVPSATPATIHLAGTIIRLKNHPENAVRALKTITFCSLSTGTHFALVFP